MNIDLNLSELFDRYLENDLNIHEMKEFDLRLKNDKSFSDSFRLHKEVDNALIEDDIMNFRRQLEKIGVRNSDLTLLAPMVVAEEITPEIDKAILEQDIIALRGQLTRIHNTVIEELNSAAVSYEMSADIEPEEVEADIKDERISALIEDIDKAIMQEEVMALRSKLELIGKKTLTSKKTIHIRRRILTYASSAVAAVFILLAAGYIFLNQNSSNSESSQPAFSEYFKAYDGISTRRGPAEYGKSVVELGIQKFNNGDYASAYELFKACMDDNSSSQVVKLYAGSCEYFLGNPDNALRLFSNWDPESPYVDVVNWYSAGCYIQKNNLEKAKVILTDLASDPSHDYYREASELLKKIVEKVK